VLVGAGRREESRQMGGKEAMAWRTEDARPSNAPPTSGARLECRPEHGIEGVLEVIEPVWWSVEACVVSDPSLNHRVAI
jgi:hypothetical protein